MRSNITLTDDSSTQLADHVWVNLPFSEMHFSAGSLRRLPQSQSQLSSFPAPLLSMLCLPVLVFYNSLSTAEELTTLATRPLVPPSRHLSRMTSDQVEVQSRSAASMTCNSLTTMVAFAHPRLLVLAEVVPHKTTLLLGNSKLRREFCFQEVYMRSTYAFWGPEKLKDEWKLVKIPQGCITFKPTWLWCLFRWPVMALVLPPWLVTSFEQCLQMHTVP